MASIAFDSIKVQGGTRLELVCTTITDSGEDLYELWFEFNHPLYLSDDTIGVALSTLCGRAYNHISYDLALSEGATKRISEFTLATITARPGVEPVSQPHQGNSLSFSGGFDSLAALSLMPSDTKLVSMDFGGRFGRERSFFERFDTTIVSTNVLSTPLPRNSWSFMGIGAILASEDHASLYHTFGSILEAGPDNLRVSPVAARNSTFPPFAAAGYMNAPYVAGLTEVGTLVVLARHNPDLIGPSLNSLASPGEEKLYRKKVLADIVADRLGIQAEIPTVQKPVKPHFSFGKNFALDFLSLYVCKFAGRSVADDLVSGLPDEVESMSRDLDLTLFERANSTLYSKFPAGLFGGLADKLAAAGIPFYTEHDWAEYQAIRGLLAKYHPVVAT